MELSEKLHELFLGFSEYHGEFKPSTQAISNGKVKGVTATRPGGGTPQLWENHLKGSRGLGIIPLLSDETVVFAGIDVDEYDKLPHAELEEKIKKHKYPLWVFRSKSGGAHLYLFMDKPEPAKMVLEYLRHMAATLGFGSSEIFPKHHKRSVEVRVSNWLNMPYYNKDDSYSPAMVNGEWVKVEAFIDLVWENRTSKEQLQQCIDKREYFKDGPPCLNILAEQKVPEYRNNFLFNAAVYYKQVFPEGWESKLYVVQDNLLEGSGTRAEIENIIKQVKKKDVKYMCKEPPLCTVCDRTSCSNKKYGVASISEKGWILLDGLTKLTDPCGGEPAYTINANGIPIWIDSVSDLINQRKFREVLMAKADVLISVSKQDSWDDRIRDLMESMQEVPLPTDATPEGMIFDYLKEYIDTNSRNVEDLPDIVMGRVYIESIFPPGNTEEPKKVACFRATSFFEFLKHRGFRAVETKKIFKMFHTVEASKHQINVGGKGIQYWRVDLEKITAIVSNEIDLSEHAFAQRSKNLPSHFKEDVVQKSDYDKPDVSRKF